MQPLSIVEKDKIFVLHNIKHGRISERLPQSKTN